MKKIKLRLTAMCILSGVSLLVGFKSEKRGSMFAIHWFYFTGTVYTAAAYNNASNYLNIGSLMPADCNGNAKLCAIQAQSTTAGVKPVLFSGYGTKVVAKQGNNTTTKVTTAMTTITVKYMPM